MATYPSAQRAIAAPRRQPLSAMDWRARAWASGMSDPAQATIAPVALMTCAQYDCSIESA